MTIERYKELLHNHEVIKLPINNSVVFEFDDCNDTFHFSYIHDGQVFKGKAHGPSRFSFNKLAIRNVKNQHLFNDENIVMLHSSRELYAFTYSIKMCKEKNEVHAEIMDRPELADDFITKADERIVVRL